jgi:4-amino-4-deoxy-L-arabinose transferase-like glycosyltransferase
MSTPAIKVSSGSTFLRRVLALDAAVTAGNGLIYLVAAGPVGRLLDVQPDLLTGLGIFLVAYGAAVGYLAARPVPPSGWVRVVIGANVAWVAASLCAMLFGWLDPSTAGKVWIPLQAAVVAGFAALQAAGLNRRERG